MPTGGVGGAQKEKIDAMTKILASFDENYASFFFPRVVSRVDPAWK
jgi:hypothetical protein